MNAGAESGVPELLAGSYPGIVEMRSLWLSAGGGAADLVFAGAPLERWRALWEKACAPGAGHGASPLTLTREALFHHPGHAVLLAFVRRYVETCRPHTRRAADFALFVCEALAPDFAPEALLPALRLLPPDADLAELFAGFCVCLEGRWAPAARLKIEERCRAIAAGPPVFAADVLARGMVCSLERSIQYAAVSANGDSAAVTEELKALLGKIPAKIKEPWQEPAAGDINSVPAMDETPPALLAMTPLLRRLLGASGPPGAALHTAARGVIAQYECLCRYFRVEEPLPPAALTATALIHGLWATRSAAAPVA